jgi:hypothetical protein
MQLTYVVISVSVLCDFNAVRFIRDKQSSKDSTNNFQMSCISYLPQTMDSI